jgi:hypothetical protein
VTSSTRKESNLLAVPNVALKQVSPRTEVELVNQKIDIAKRKMSRYFAARNNIQSNAAAGPLTSSTTAGTMTTAPSSHLKNKPYHQSSLTQLSMEIVRHGSPFFGVGKH